MVKGYKDSTGKFHPITDYKGVRKSRYKKDKTKGIIIRKARNQDLVYAESYNRGQNIKVVGHGNDWMLLVDRNVVGRATTQEEIFEMYDKVNVHPETGSPHFFDPRIPRIRKKLVEMSPQELLSLEIITDVEDNFSKILKRTAKNKACFFVEGNLMRPDVVAERHGSTKGQIEEFCGAVTDQLEKFIWRKYGKKAGCAEQGQYNGEGAENSTDFNQIEKTVKHEWFRLADGTIIDGAGGQFVDERKTVRNEDRLRIIFPDDPRQNWYNPDTKICDLCGGRLMGGKCPSTDVHKAMALVKAGVPIEEARRQVGLR